MAKWIAPPLPGSTIREAPSTDDQPFFAPVLYAITGHVAGSFDPSRRLLSAAQVPAGTGTVAVEERLLLAGQNDPTQNGIYVVGALSPLVLRAADGFRLKDSPLGGSLVAVRAGVHQGTIFQLEGPRRISLGGTPLAWTPRFIPPPPPPEPLPPLLIQTEDVTFEAHTLKIEGLAVEEIESGVIKLSVQGELGVGMMSGKGSPQRRVSAEAGQQFFDEETGLVYINVSDPSPGDEWRIT